MNPRILLGILVALFACGYLRAASVSAYYASPACQAFFQKYEATNPGQFNYALYLKGQGIASEEQYRRARGEPEEDGEDPPGGLIAGTRSFCDGILGACMTEHDAGLYRAVLLGSKGDLDPAVRELYQSAGIAHLLAVSGLHVSTLGMGLYNLLRRRRMDRRRAGVLAGILIVFYMFLTGASGSVVRAVIMLLFVFAASGLSRSCDMLTALSAAAAVLVLCRPYMVFQSGFQLSFGAVGAICVTAASMIRGRERLGQYADHPGRRQKRIRRAERLSPFASMVLTGISVQLTTLPIIAWHYYRFPPYGFLLNFLVIPLMAAVLCSGLAVLAAGTFQSVLAVPAAGCFVPRAGLFSAAAAAPGHYILRLYELLCRWSMRLPGASLLIGRPPLARILLYYLFLGAMLWVLPKTGRRLRIRKPALVFIPWLLLLCISSGVLRPRPLADLRITAIDVGQGDGFLIEKEGRSVLIDGGSSDKKKLGEDILEPLLLSRGIGSIDLALVSHADKDHISGLQYLLSPESSIEVRRILLPAAAAEDAAYDELRSVPSDCLENGREICRLGNASLCCIFAGNEGEAEDRNRHSTVLLLEEGSFRMLFTGDLSAEDEPAVCRLYREQHRPMGITVLKTAHHGSSSSTTEEFLDAFPTRYALISCGRNNRYGHPHREVTQRLEEHGAVLLQTPAGGAWEILTDGERMKIRSFLGCKTGREDVQ